MLTLVLRAPAAVHPPRGDRPSGRAATEHGPSGPRAVSWFGPAARWTTSRGWVRAAAGGAPHRSHRAKFGSIRAPRDARFAVCRSPSEAADLRFCASRPAECGGTQRLGHG